MEKETFRIEAFSDAVFAIAITLLVLDLRVPSGTQYADPKVLLSRLTEEWPAYFAFGLSFFSIFIMWVNHHKIFRQISKRNTAVTFANGLILFLASLVSWPTALLARYYGTPSASLATALYTALFVVINLAYNLLWYLASRDRQLLRKELSLTHIRRIQRNYVLGIPWHLAAFLCSFYYPSLALALCALLWTYWAFTSGKLKLNEQGTIS